MTVELDYREYPGSAVVAVDAVHAGVASIGSGCVRWAARRRPGTAHPWLSALKYRHRIMPAHAAVHSSRAGIPGLGEPDSWCGAAAPGWAGG